MASRECSKVLDFGAFGFQTFESGMLNLYSKTVVGIGEIHIHKPSLFKVNLDCFNGTLSVIPYTFLAHFKKNNFFLIFMGSHYIFQCYSMLQCPAENCSTFCA